MTPQQKTILATAVGMILAGLSVSFAEANTLPHAWAWIVPFLAWAGGALKGTVLASKPADKAALKALRKASTAP